RCSTPCEEPSPQNQPHPQARVTVASAFGSANEGPTSVPRSAPHSAQRCSSRGRKTLATRRNLLVAVRVWPGRAISDISLLPFVQRSRGGPQSKNPLAHEQGARLLNSLSGLSPPERNGTLA